MLILRKTLDRPLNWDELDHNQQALEIDPWQKQDYELRQKVYVIDGSYTTIYDCVHSHVKEIYSPANVFITEVDGIILWIPIASTYNGQPLNTDIYVTGMTYNSTETGNTLTVHQTLGYPDISVFVPSYSLYDHYVSSAYLTGNTLNIYRTGGLPSITVDLQPIINIATGVTHTDTYVTGASLNNSTYHLAIKRNDGVTVDVNLAVLRDGNYFTTGATLTGSEVEFRKNFGSAYYLDLSALVVTGATSGYSGYSGADGVIGSNGASGYSGINGGNGASGYSGINGSNGSNGVSGYSGINGASGYSGQQGLYGGASLILNGDGACTTDWNVDGEAQPYHWTGIGGAGLTIVTGLGFSNNACEATAGFEYNSVPNGMEETSYMTIPGITYTLSFQYESSVALDVSDGFNTYASFAAHTGSTSGVTMSFTAIGDGYLCFGYGTGRAAYGGEWWIIDKVTLRCGSCSGGTGSALIINNNADNRILTANGTTTSIDAESGFTYDKGITHNIADSPNSFWMESYHTGSTSQGDVETDGVSWVSVRGRGTKSARKAAMVKDVLFRQEAYATYGTGTTVHPPVLMAQITSTLKSDLNSETPLLKSEYRIKMNSGSVIVDSMDSKLLIDEFGDTTLFGGLTVNRTITLSTNMVTDNAAADQSFSYRVVLTGETVTITLPQTEKCKGRVYHFVVNSTTGGSLVIDAGNGYTVAWSAQTRTFNARGQFMTIQSDGVNNWIPISYNTTAF